MKLNKYIDTPTERALFAGAVLLITGIVITILKGDIPPNLKDLMQMLFIAFVAGTGFEHYTKSRWIKKPRNEEVND